VYSLVEALIQVLVSLLEETYNVLKQSLNSN
jgi:hypothetical protein